MKRVLSVILTLIILSGCIFYFFPFYLPPELLPAAHTVQHWIKETERWIWPEPKPGPDILSYEVIRAIDGDTILVSVSGAETKVRLIGIDAPESVHPDAEKNTPEGERASLFLKQYVDGRRVTLEYDQELKDKYDRTLAYVYMDGMMLQDVMLGMGMARTLVMEPNTRYQHHFEMIEKEAREGSSGFWGTGFFEK